MQIACPEGWETQEESDDVYTLNPPTVLGKELKEGEGSDAQVKGINVLEAAGPCVISNMEYEFVRPPLGGLDNALVGKIGWKLLFVCTVCSFKHCDVGVVGGERGHHAIKGGRV